jgi:hypothetical protein
VGEDLCSAATVRLLQVWLDAAAVKEGAVFRRLAVFVGVGRGRLAAPQTEFTPAAFINRLGGRRIRRRRRLASRCSWDRSRCGAQRIGSSLPRSDRLVLDIHHVSDTGTAVAGIALRRTLYCSRNASR